MTALFATANRSGLTHLSLDGHRGYCGKFGYFPAAKVTEEEWRESGWCCHLCMRWLNEGQPRPDIPSPNSGPLGEGCPHDYHYEYDCPECYQQAKVQFEAARRTWKYLVRLSGDYYRGRSQMMLWPMIIVHLPDCRILDDVYAFGHWIAVDQKPAIRECRRCFGNV